MYAHAENDLPSITLFHGEECPHCQAERKFLNELKKDFPDLEINEYEVWHNKENAKVFMQKAKELGITQLGVPLTIIGDKYMVGFDKPENSGEEIKKMLGIDKNILPDNLPDQKDIFSLPIIGEINIKNLSLPVLSMALGLLDGFNPCSMWALLMLITILIASKSRAKVWVAGSVFIITSAISYFLFMSAWFNAFLFVGYIAWVRVIIGLVAIIAGIISIREFSTSKPGVCEIDEPEEKQKIIERIKKVLQSASWPALVIGVAGIAFSVNLVEMMCSLGIPVVFTETLALANLSAWKHYAYIGLYDLFYMMDDIVVLLIAGFSMKFLRFSEKYTHYSRLMVGLLMLILGIIFIFNPELLTIG